MTFETEPAGARRRRRRRWRAGLARLLGAVLVMTLAVGNLTAVPARADLTDGDMVSLQRSLFTNYMRLHAPGLRGLQDLVLSDELTRWRQIHPEADEQQIREHLVYMQQAIEAQLKADDWQRTTYEYMIKLLEAISGIPAAAPYTPAVKAMLEMTVGKELLEWGNIQDQVQGATQISRWQEQYFVFQDWVWSAVTDLAQRDPAYNDAWSSVIGVRAGIVGNASIDQLEADPLLRMFLNLDTILANQGNQTLYMQELRKQLAAALAKLTENAQAINELKNTAAAHPVKVGVQPDPKAYMAAMKEVKETQQLIEAAGSVVYILSTLAGFFDPTFSKQIAIIGKAALGIATAINQFKAATAGIALGQALMSMSAVVLTGNILAAVMTLLPLFMDQGPSPEQIILDQIVALRRDVRDLANQMHDRFNRIEKALVNIYDEMLNQFDRLQGQIEDIRASIDDIENRLLSVEGKVDTLGGIIIRSISDAELKDLRTAMSKYLNYEETYGVPIPSYNGSGDRYTEPENEFYVSAVTLSRDSAFTVPSGVFATADPVNTLNNYRSTGAINYLSWLARNRYDTAFQEPVPVISHPLVWGMSARSYSTLAIQNPGYASQVSTSRAGNVADSGNEIQNAVRAFSKPRSNPDASGNWTNTLFANLLSAYRSAATQLGSSVDIVRRDTVQEGKTYELFGSGTQPIPAGAMPIEPATVCDLARPTNVKLLDTPAEVFFATYVQPSKPKVRLTCSETFENVRDYYNEYREWSTADIRVTFQVQYQPDPNANWVTLRAFSYKWAAGTIYSCNLDEYGLPTSCTIRYEHEVAKRDWPTQKANFEKYAVRTVENQAKFDEIRAGNVAFLQGRQGRAFARLRCDRFR